MINKKLLAKSILYRVISFLFIFIVCRILRQEIYIAVLAGIAEFIIKTILYYAYEIAWKKLSGIIGTKGND